MSLPLVTMIGNLTADPVLRQTNSGKSFATLRVAAPDRKKNPETGSWEDGDTCFLDVISWRSAEAVSKALVKGTKVMILGNLRQKDFTDANGTKRTSYEIQAEDISIVIKGTGPDIKVVSSNSPAPVLIDPWNQSSTIDDKDVPF